MSFDPRAVAEQLRHSEATGEPTALLTSRFEGFSWAQARAVAQARDELRLADGDELIGYKLGWTSGAMREALGIDQPNWGTLWRSQIVAGQLDPARLIHPKVEPEMVFRAAEDLAATGSTLAVTQAGQWALGLEVVDPRYPSYEFDWLDNTADNSSCARVALGAFTELEQDPATVAIEFSDGSVARSGLGADAMGSPAHAVAWLVRSLASEHKALLAGQIVFTGGLAAPFDVESGRTYTCTGDGLGKVAFVCG